jgi:four helix bundle protein
MKDFKKLLVWQLGMEITNSVYELVRDFPQEELFALRSQVTRAAVSIPANIAEGSAKDSERDYKRYLSISLGSAFELETHLLIVQQRRWVSDSKIAEALGLVVREQQLLSKFIKRLA